VKKAISFAFILPIITAIGAQIGTWITPLLVIVAVCVITILVAKDKIKGKELYFYLYAIALGLVWQTTMMGQDVVGSDIHTELYYARFNQEHFWDISYPDSSNTSFVVGILSPMIATILKWDMVWVFKIILPLFLACVPIILFQMYKGIFGEKRAYFASIFFMIIPVYSMEIAQIAKSMVAEACLAVVFYALVNNWKQWIKFIMVTIFLGLAILAHYTVGIVGICFLLGLFIFRLITDRWSWRLVSNRKTNLWVIAVSLVISVAIFWGYHGYAANGSAVRSVKDIVSVYAPVVNTEMITVNQTHEDVKIEKIEPDIPKSLTASLPDRMNKAPMLVKVGTGFDFMEMPIEGKVFRLIQYLTQLMIIVGVLWVVFAYKKHNYPAEYVGLVGCACILLAVSIVIPSVSEIVNMSRVLHYALFAVAPMFVVGTEYISNRIKHD
jgi:uncharacterized membrane protein